MHDEYLLIPTSNNLSSTTSHKLCRLFQVNSAYLACTVHLPLFLLFCSSCFLALSSLLSSRVCVSQPHTPLFVCGYVCVYVSGRSACLMALVEGPCSPVNPPPALPATAAQKRSVCLYVAVCVCFCVLQGCSPWGDQATVLAAAIAADSSRQQDLGLRLGFLCQEPAVSAASSTSFPPFFEVTPLSSFPEFFAAVHLA